MKTWLKCHGIHCAFNICTVWHWLVVCQVWTERFDHGWWRLILAFRLWKNSVAMINPFIWIHFIVVHHWMFGLVTIAWHPCWAKIGQPCSNQRPLLWFHTPVCSPKFPFLLRKLLCKGLFCCFQRKRPFWWWRQHSDNNLIHRKSEDSTIAGILE